MEYYLKVPRSASFFDFIRIDNEGLLRLVNTDILFGKSFIVQKTKKYITRVLISAYNGLIEQVS